MFRMTIAASAALVFAAASTPAIAADDDWKPYASQYVSEVMRNVITAPEVIAAIHAQNVANAGVTAEQIDALDRQWRAERRAGAGPLTAEKMTNPLSMFLRGYKSAVRDGAVIEIFVMDNKGLNVGQTDPTSDFMQGDEDKWTKTAGAGPWMTFTDEPEEEDGVRSVQISSAVVDNDKAIGAITITLDLSKVVPKKK